MSSMSTHLDPARLADLANDPLWAPRRIADMALGQSRAINMPAASTAHATLHSLLAARKSRAAPDAAELLAALVQAAAQIEKSAELMFWPLKMDRDQFLSNWIGDDSESYETWLAVTDVARRAGAAL